MERKQLLKALETCVTNYGSAGEKNARCMEECGLLVNGCRVALMKEAHEAMRWRDVNHELPKDETQVLIMKELRNGKRTVSIGYYAEDGPGWVAGVNSNVVAWMPLPEV